MMFSDVCPRFFETTCVFMLLQLMDKLLHHFWMVDKTQQWNIHHRLISLNRLGPLMPLGSTSHPGFQLPLSGWHETLFPATWGIPTTKNLHLPRGFRITLQAPSQPCHCSLLQGHSALDEAKDFEDLAKWPHPEHISNYISRYWYYYIDIIYTVKNEPEA